MASNVIKSLRNLMNSLYISNITYLFTGYISLYWPVRDRTFNFKKYVALGTSVSLKALNDTGNKPFRLFHLYD